MSLVGKVRVHRPPSNHLAANQIILYRPPEPPAPLVYRCMPGGHLGLAVGWGQCRCSGCDWWRMMWSRSQVSSHRKEWKLIPKPQDQDNKEDIREGNKKFDSHTVCAHSNGKGSHGAPSVETNKRNGKNFFISSFLALPWTIMMSADDRALEELLYGSDLGDLGDRADIAELSGGQTGTKESAAADNEPLTCAGCSEQVCDRFFLLAAGSVWHDVCLRCSRCHCELQTHPSLYCRDGNIYCHQDYCRMFGGGQCARCFQPIPASDLVMRSGDLTFHPHCFSCQECDVTLIPGNLYCMQGHNLYCQSHYHDDGRSMPPLNDLQPKPNLKEGATYQLFSLGDCSVQSGIDPQPRRQDTGIKLDSGLKLCGDGLHFR
ncbi:hypothetical protein NQZ68_031114 [Dissostichus eleginoides]|nr:hypothetical protein NQZ68_031114 [Dissostichus eleginoides]